MATLKTTYTDDVLDTSVNTERKYEQKTNSDGTISLEDKTVYRQVGDTFGAMDINKTNEQVNANTERMESVVDEVRGLLGDQVIFSLSGTNLYITSK